MLALEWQHRCQALHTLTGAAWFTQPLWLAVKYTHDSAPPLQMLPGPLVPFPETARKFRPRSCGGGGPVFADAAAARPISWIARAMLSQRDWCSLKTDGT